MPIFTKKNHEPIFFAHIPKTGGSSVEAMFSQAGYHNGKCGSKGFLNQHAVAALYTTWDDLPIKKFVIIREPIARFISELNFKSIRGAQADQTAKRWFEEYKKNPTINDNHLRPQVEFIVPGMDLYIFEEGAIKQIAEDYGLKPRHLNIRHKHTKREDLSEETIEFLKEFYKEDFKMYEEYKNS